MTGAARYAPVAVLLVCLATLVPLQRRIDASSEQAKIAEEALYLSNGTSIRKLALGYEALLADVYWMRLVQYFGRKVLEDPTILNERSDRLALIYPLTDIITDLDPRYTYAYRFGGFFAHDYVDPVKGFTLLEKGIRNNPTAWRLYQDLAFLYWSDGRCKEASDAYAEASKIRGAPTWMASLAGTVLADCGDLDTARQMYLHMLEETTDARVVKDVRRKLLELQALEEVTAIAEAVGVFRERTGRYPASLAQVRPLLAAHPGARQMTFEEGGLPLDPMGVPYRYDPVAGSVGPDPSSVRLPRGVLNLKAAR
jgi:hypothetical protein